MSLGMASASVAAFADDRQPAATADPQAATASAGNVDAPQHTKRISKNDDGTYTLSMDVTGKSDESTEQQVVPLDIALVLDVSGSMNELSGKLVYNEVELLSMNPISTYYVEKDGSYQAVRCSAISWGRCTTWQDQDSAGQKYTVTYNWIGGPSASVSPDVQFYKSKQSEETRLDALKDAVTYFLDQVEDQNQRINDPGKKVQVALIKYAGKNSDKIGNDTYNEDGYN